MSNSMKLIKFIGIILFCLFLGSCPHPGIDILIGDYDYHLEAWNSQNMPDYTLLLDYYSKIPSINRVFITVKNGTPVSSEPEVWIAAGKMSTVPDIFSFILEEEKKLRNSRCIETKGYFQVRYDSQYHNPNSISFASITTGSDRSSEWWWTIKLTPLVENEMESEE